MSLVSPTDLMGACGVVAAGTFCVRGISGSRPGLLVEPLFDVGPAIPSGATHLGELGTGSQVRPLAECPYRLLQVGGHFLGGG